ncbi:MAG: cupin domain-containing protein [Gammaproteobacteria bacterium]|jgi:mannose-6-phosphate isomerase-like protein (cupin superfamily)|nr:cupin domain-containing protein [Gammaproteobacteria bacterium]
MLPSIKTRISADEFYIDEGCFITEVSNSADDPDLSIALSRVAPGVTTQWHRLKGVTERYSIISGTGSIEVGNLAPQTVSTGDVVIIPPMCRQRIRNTGAENLLFYAICTPRFTSEVYELLGNLQQD